ncbi:antibiotic biosynthesis monooxygenase [Cohnella thailandensis]|uniref:Antibiotic biosynthesis monooxygenase n=1 Tax=Cohnella thailandensis TaxID=557557 RepID=A0A841T022_9BACL|nr:antibiotic biosynthesis monooxygenase [Cohnella thailandensis]MBB6636882.1 antibiotic biosynthesis monooxygenase [Cohnella thailandensis]MBP1973238.1 heme oxygenase (staphylobilin-producing) [Cohnella thailandensis]
MIVAINTIRIKPGHGSEVAERFKNPKGVQHAPGFVKMELLLSSEEDHDELRVCTAWENKEAFDGWVNSDAFKQAHSHSRPAAPSVEAGQGAPGQRPPSVMLGSKLSIHEVVFSI